MDFIGPLHFLLPLVGFFVLQCFVFNVTPRAFPLLFPNAPPLDARTSRALSAFIASVIHHLIVVPVSIFAMLDFARGRGFPWGPASATPALTLAYLLMDCAYYVVPEAVEGRSYVYLPHHLMGIAVALAVLASPPQLLRWAPMLLICEASSIPYCVSYVLRKAGPPFSSGATVLAMEGLFAVLFAATRVVNLPVGVAALTFSDVHASDRALFGWGGLFALWVLCVMQVVWFWEILQKVSATLFAQKGKPA